MTDLSRHGLLSVKADPVALLVDGENLSSDFAAAVLSIAMEYGIPTVRRVYGKPAQIGGWAEKGFRLVPTRAGKNAADLLLSVEAVSLALREQFHTLIIASSDCDYAYLAEHLRELGHEIIGIGEVQSATGYRATCSAFVELVRKAEPQVVDVTAPVVVAAMEVPVTGTPAKPEPETLPMSVLEKQVSAVIKARNDKTGLTITELNALMRRQHQTKICETAEGSWRNYLLARPGRFVCDPRGPNARVRLKRP